MELGTWASEQATGAMTIDDDRGRKLVTWSSKLAVGVQTIDEQHMKLIDLVNQLSDAMYSGRGQNMLSRALKVLEAYALYHFDTEERLMDAHEYSESKTHKNGHKIFTETVRRFRRRLDSGHVLVSAEVLFFLREWIVSHIMQGDRDLGLVLNRSGAK